MVSSFRRPCATLRGHFIGGQWASGTGTFADMNPSDGSTWAIAPDAGVAETRSWKLEGSRFVEEVLFP